jgi:hypothetical protein
MNFTRTLPLGAVITGLLAVGAVAATPESGEVSAAKPKLKWSGETTGSYFARLPVASGAAEDAPCESPSCDTFALTVKDQADLTVSGNVPAGTGTGASQVTLRITKPDGSFVVGSGDAEETKPFKLKITNAAPGAYKIDYWNNFFDGPVAYTGTAELAIAAPVAPAAPGPAAPASPPATAEDFSFTVKAPKLSAKKVTKAKKFAVPFTVSREVAKVDMQLRQGKKVLAKGAAGRTASSGKVTLKAKKLKAGSYTLFATATDARGTSVSRTVKLKIKK